MDSKITLPFDHVEDASGLRCPYPLLRAKKGLKVLKNGQVLLLIATDPATLEDVKSFATQTGCHLLQTTVENGLYRFWIQKP